MVDLLRNQASWSAYFLTFQSYNMLYEISINRVLAVCNVICSLTFRFFFTAGVSPNQKKVRFYSAQC